jgi:8-oxo-dGTP pyrophosphatase MutT (NUDIX family)
LTASRSIASLDRQEGSARLLSRAAAALMLVMLVCVSNATAREEFFAAGVMLIAHKDGSAYLLLGKPHGRPWYELFAGRRGSATDADARRPETAYETALREAYEESRGYLNPEYLQQRIGEDQYLEDGGFVFFRAVVEPFAIEDMRKVPVPLSGNPLAFTEISDYAWVNVDAIIASENAVVVDEAGRSIDVRPQLKGRVLRAREAGWLD